jgi:hypothetical protein
MSAIWESANWTRQTGNRKFGMLPSQYGKLVNYSGQGVEKIDDDIKKFINQKQTNMMLHLTH